MLLWAAFFAVLMVCVAAFSIHPPDPKYWGANYVVRAFYCSRAVAGFGTGTVVYATMLWIQRTNFRRRNFVPPE